jgi:hypothetical protein
MYGTKSSGVHHRTNLAIMSPIWTTQVPKTKKKSRRSMPYPSGTTVTSSGSFSVSADSEIW